MNETLFSSLTADFPSASLKLSAAWDGLSPESQMEVLQAIQDRGRLPFDVATKAMASPSPFVRYLTAECLMNRRHLKHSKDESSTDKWPRFEVADGFRPAWNAALIDSDPLVRSVVEQTLSGYARLTPETCGTFWALSKPARFRYLQSRDGITDGQDVISLIDFAVASKRPDDEVTEIIVEYVKIVKSRQLHGRFDLLKFAERSPDYAGFIRDELETPRPPNSLVAWVEPRVIPTDEEKVHFEIKEPAGVVAHLARQVCLWGAFISLTIGVVGLFRMGTIAPLPFLIALVLWTPPILKALLVHEVEKESDFPLHGSATPKKLLWIRRAWRLSWLLIVIVGVGAAAILLAVFGPAVDDAYRTLDLRVLVSANILLLLFFMWRVSKMSVILRQPLTKPDSR